MIKIAILASGNGSNAEQISKYFTRNQNISVSLILTNNSKAGVIKRANNLGITVITFNKEDLYANNTILDIFTDHGIDFIVLAGFLWLVPENLISNYKNKIINIHPALLPKYGGKGMYGMRVHESVIENSEKQSGITIHFVNSKYDEGHTIFQASVDIVEDDTPETLAQKIHLLEYEHFPKIIEQTINNYNQQIND